MGIILFLGSDKMTDLEILKSARDIMKKHGIYSVPLEFLIGELERKEVNVNGKGR